MTKLGKKIIKIVSGLMVLVLLAGCSAESGDVGTKHNETNEKDNKEKMVLNYDNAILKRVEYGWESGTMLGGFDIDINENEIVTASFYPTNAGAEGYSKNTINNVKITADKWKMVCEAVEVVKPVLEEVSESDFGQEQLDPDVQILDGGDTFYFFLTWEIEGNTQRKEYYKPDYERFSVLSTLLEELAEPIGRDIPVYAPPVITGLYYTVGEKHGADYYSFQCTKKTEGENYYFFSYYPVNGKETSYPNREVTPEVWEKIYAKAVVLGIPEMEKGDNKKSPYITLYLSNGRQYYVNPDTETSNELRNFFLELVGSEPVVEKKSFIQKLFKK